MTRVQHFKGSTIIINDPDKTVRIIPSQLEVNNTGIVEDRLDDLKGQGYEIDPQGFNRGRFNRYIGER